MATVADLIMYFSRSILAYFDIFVKFLNLIFDGNRKKELISGVDFYFLLHFQSIPLGSFTFQTQNLANDLP